MLERLPPLKPPLNNERGNHQQGSKSPRKPHRYHTYRAEKQRIGIYRKIDRGA
jgi:hypothetical protein